MPTNYITLTRQELYDMVGLTRFSGHLGVYREGVSNGEQRNEVSSGVS